jgi:hypothetical protein
MLRSTCFSYPQPPREPKKTEPLTALKAADEPKTKEEPKTLKRRPLPPDPYEEALEKKKAAKAEAPLFILPPIQPSIEKESSDVPGSLKDTTFFRGDVSSRAGQVR